MNKEQEDKDMFGDDLMGWYVFWNFLGLITLVIIATYVIVKLA